MNNQMTFKDKQIAITSELKAPKNLFNSFGKYHYRNAESICEAVKPLLQKYRCVLCLSDEVVDVGERIYVKASAMLYDADSTAFISATAYAREPDDKKGMDASQITGTASSYARKYALNGLFLLDDTKDPDTNEYKTENDARNDDSLGELKKGAAMHNPEDPINAKQVAMIQKTLDNHNIKPDTFCEYFNVSDLDHTTWAMYGEYFRNGEALMKGWAHENTGDAKAD